jgi:hypothetical protein
MVLKTKRLMKKPEHASTPKGTAATDTSAVIAHELRVADTFFSRAKGLLGERSLEPGAGLWIKRGNSIHMFFMRFAIDAVFVDRNLRVKAVYRHLKPWRMTRVVWGASSVFELPAGTLDKHPVQIGDELYVCD